MSTCAGICQYQFDAGRLSPLTPDRLAAYRAAYAKYDQIRCYNLGIRAQRLAGSTDISYWRFETYVERQQYILGQQLHVRLYPAVDWTDVVEV